MAHHAPAVETRSEEALVAAAQAGDRDAFRQLYEWHASDVLRYAVMPLVRDATLAEDMVAETFVRAMENVHRFRWQGRGILPWLIRIAKNLCLDHLRKGGRQTQWPDEYEQMVPDPKPIDAEGWVGDRQQDAEFADRTARCLDSLNPRYRRVIQLRLIEGRAREDAARALDVTIGTLDVLLFRACRSFRTAYARMFGAAPFTENP